MIYSLIFFLMLPGSFNYSATQPKSNLNLYYGPETLTVSKTSDFKVTGEGGSKNWARTGWIEIPIRELSKKTQERTTRIKILYSETGLYFLFDCTDTKLTSSFNADFMDLWKEDVVEVFLWPDGRSPTYFEYEISPLNFELPILISNKNGELARWMPFHYEKDRRVVHATSVRGGERKSGAAVSGWIAEFFIPYQLLRPLNNIRPQPGTKWRANFYRVDYDDGKPVSWSWQLTGQSFHDYSKFGYLLFE